MVMKISKVEFFGKLITCLFLHSTLAIRLPYTNYGLINRMIYLIRNEEMSHDISVSTCSDLQINNNNQRLQYSSLFPERLWNSKIQRPPQEKTEIHQPPNLSVKSSHLDIRKHRSTTRIISRLQKQNHTHQLHRYRLWCLSGSYSFFKTVKRFIQ